MADRSSASNSYMPSILPAKYAAPVSTRSDQQKLSPKPIEDVTPVVSGYGPFGADRRARTLHGAH